MLSQVRVTKQIEWEVGSEHRFNKWFHDEHVSAYIRKGRRYRDGDITVAVELANIAAAEPYTSTSCSQFLIVLRALEETGLPVFVENVLNERLVPLLLRLGYKQIGDEQLPSFYRHPE